MCAAAARRSRLAGRVAVFRVGQLGGDSIRGVWNASEAWPLMLAVGIKELRALPALRERLDWLPVDVAARALVEGMDGDARAGRYAWEFGGADSGLEEEDVDVPSHPTIRVMHVAHDGPNPSWEQMLSWLQEERFRTRPFEIVDPARWVELLEQASTVGLEGTTVTSPPRKTSAGRERSGEGSDDGIARAHPAFKLLDLWKSAYGSGKAEGEGEGESESESDINIGDTDTNPLDERSQTFAMEKTKIAMPALRHLRPVDKAYVLRVWRWIEQNT